MVSIHDGTAPGWNIRLLCTLDWDVGDVLVPASGIESRA